MHTSVAGSIALAVEAAIVPAMNNAAILGVDGVMARKRMKPGSNRTTKRKRPGSRD